MEGQASEILLAWLLSCSTGLIFTDVADPRWPGQKGAVRPNSSTPTPMAAPLQGVRQAHVAFDKHVEDSIKSQACGKRGGREAHVYHVRGMLLFLQTGNIFRHANQIGETWWAAIQSTWSNMPRHCSTMTRSCTYVVIRMTLLCVSHVRVCKPWAPSDPTRRRWHKTCTSCSGSSRPCGQDSCAMQPGLRCPCSFIAPSTSHIHTSRRCLLSYWAWWKAQRYSSANTPLSTL